MYWNVVSRLPADLTMPICTTTEQETLDCSRGCNRTYTVVLTSVDMISYGMICVLNQGHAPSRSCVMGSFEIAEPCVYLYPTLNASEACWRKQHVYSLLITFVLFTVIDKS